MPCVSFSFFLARALRYLIQTPFSFVLSSFFVFSLPCEVCLWQPPQPPKATAWGSAPPPAPKKGQHRTVPGETLFMSKDSSCTIHTSFLFCGGPLVAPVDPALLFSSDRPGWGLASCPIPLFWFFYLSSPLFYPPMPFYLFLRLSSSLRSAFPPRFPHTKPPDGAVQSTSPPGLRHGQQCTAITRRFLPKEPLPWPPWSHAFFLLSSPVSRSFYWRGRIVPCRWVGFPNPDRPGLSKPGYPPGHPQHHAHEKLNNPARSPPGRFSAFPPAAVPPRFCFRLFFFFRF